MNQKPNPTIITNFVTKKPSWWHIVPQHAYYHGWLRVAPLHRWSIVSITQILELVARRPFLFAFADDVRIAVVNTTHLLPSARGRAGGIAVFGMDRGCRTIVVPSSASGHPYDEVDAKLIEPLIRRNPNVEVLYLARHCEPIAHHLAPMLKNCTQLRTLILPDWEDPVAINRLVMAAKNLQTLDLNCPDELFKYWNNEVAVESMCELFEMHLKLKEIIASRSTLQAIQDCTKWSRCKHQINLNPQKDCMWSLVFKYIWIMNMYFLGYFIAVAVWYLLSRFVFELKGGEYREGEDEEKLPIKFKLLRIGVYVVLMIVCPTCYVFVDHVKYRSLGRRWVHLVKPLVLARRRLDGVLSNR